MLSLTRDYKQLLRYGGNTLYHTHEEHLPPVPLACTFNVLGRLGSLQGFTEHGELITAIKAICLKSALKKATQSAPGGVPRVPKTPAQLAAIEQAAANPPWLTEVAEYMSAHPDQPCRYTTIEDLLHPNSISRFHFLIKREPVEGPFQFRYSIKDLGSLNGLYVDDIKVSHRNWAVLREGARLRFAPSTRLAKKYVQCFAEAESAGRRPQLPPMPLTTKDMYIEYQFNHRMNEVCMRRAAQLEAPSSRAFTVQFEGDESKHDSAMRPAIANAAAASPVAPAAAASAAGSSPALSRPNQLPSPAAALPAGYHQNSAALARQREQAAADRSFYSRFSSATAVDLSADDDDAPAIRDGDLNAAPLPTNYRPPAVPAAANARNPKRGRDDTAAAPASALAASAAVSASASAAESASKRARPDAPAPAPVSSQPRAISDRRALSATQPNSSGDGLMVDDDDDDRPITAMRPTVPMAAAAAAAASSSSAAAAAVPAAAAPAPAHAPTTGAHINAMLEEFQCSICSEVIYQNVVLDCGHSFCKSCILTWFKKQKICPVCRGKHKGPPRAVRSVDNVISVLLKQCSTVEEQRERQVRIARVDAESKERAIQELERSRIKAQRVAERAPQMGMGMGAGGPPDRIAAALAARRAVNAVLHARVPDSSDDEDYVPGDGDWDEEDDEDAVFDDVDDEGFPLAALVDDHEEAQWHAAEFERMARMDRQQQPRAGVVPRMVAALEAAHAAAPAPPPAPMAAAASVPAVAGPRYIIDQAANGRAKCLTCNLQILAQSLRLQQYGGARWHHLLCVAQAQPARALRGRIDGLDALAAPAKALADSIIG